jgi:7-carboxy-7-deazaguanine synthase
VLTLSRLPTGAPEIFTTLQGEGITIGVPSVFVRLSGCSLACTWCDTRYTWDWARYDPRLETVQVEVPDVANQLVETGVLNVVITGGEPLLQRRQLVQLASLLKDAGRRVEVETSGTIRPQPDLANVIDQWNVSPKLANSANALEKRRVHEALQWFAHQENAFLKFVVVSQSDLVEVDMLVRRYGVPPRRVLLMPEGRDSQTLAVRSGWIAGECVDRGFRFTTRLHVLLWGDERGR